jgi:hypothetical protein
MQGSTSRNRNVYGEIHKEKFEDVRPSEAITEGSLIDVNDHFIAVRKFVFLNYLKGFLVGNWRRMCCSIRSFKSH